MIKKIVLCLFFITNYSLLSQNDIIKHIQNSGLPIKTKINKIDSVFITFKKKRTDSLYSYKDQYAFWLYKNKQLNKSIDVCNDALIIAKELKDSLLIQKSFFWLGYFHKKINSPLKAIPFFNEIFNYNSNNKIAANAYFQLGSLYNRINDYDNSINHYKLAILLFKNQKNIPLLRDSYINISDLYFKNKKQIFDGINFCKKADSISNIIPTSKNKKYLIKIILASLFNDDRTLDIDIASKYYHEAMKIAKSQNNFENINEINLLIGNLFNSTNAKKSIYYLDKVRLNVKKEDSLLLSNLYFNYAITHNFTKNYNKSISTLNKAILYLIGTNFTKNEYRNNLILINSKHQTTLLHFLPVYAKTYLHYYEATNNKVFLQQSSFYYKLSDKLIDLVKVNSNKFKSRLFWREKSAEIYNSAIKVCYLSNNINDAFYFMEKNKAILLMEDIISQNYKLSLTVPQKLLLKESILKNNLIKLKNNNTLHKDSLFKATVDLERTLHIFQDSIYLGKKRHHKTPIITIDNVQKNLTNNDVFVEYNISNTDGFVIFITNKSYFFYPLKNIKSVKNSLTKLTVLLKKPFDKLEDVKQFASLSFYVFDNLFPTSEIKELIENKNLIIALDNHLSYLSFESLITQRNSLEYLIKKSTISYTYSMSFLNRNKQLYRVPKKKFIGFAPIDFNYDSLTSLSNSKNELLAINSITAGDNYIGELATKQNFIDLCDNYNIIHLATHADVGKQESPWIAFKDEKLILSELYTTKTQADLVVLSACNTSLGEMVNGEGILSLARGFFYSGSNTVISSLWNINDKVNASIMVDFYKNLKNRKTKAESLRQAKLKYLKNHILTEASPYYWASSILIGNTDKLNVNNSNNFILFIGIVLTLILLAFYFRSKA